MNHALHIDVPSLRQIADIVDLGREMHNESQFSIAPYNPMKTEQMLLHARAHPDWLLLCAIDGDNQVIGMFMGLVSTYFMADGLMAEDKVLFVTKSKRGVIAAKRMLNEYVAWARAKGCTQAYMNHTTGVDTDRGARFFEHVGFGKIGTIHVVNFKEN